MDSTLFRSMILSAAHILPQCSLCSDSPCKLLALASLDPKICFVLLCDHHLSDHHCNTSDSLRFVSTQVPQLWKRWCYPNLPIILEDALSVLILYPQMPCMWVTMQTKHCLQASILKWIGLILNLQSLQRIPVMYIITVAKVYVFACSCTPSANYLCLHDERGYVL